MDKSLFEQARPILEQIKTMVLKHIMWVGSVRD